MHPLVNDLSVLSDNELNTKYNELASKLSQAYRYGSGQLVHQIQLVMEDYRLELDRRNQKLMDDMMAKSGSLSSLIDVK